MKRGKKSIGEERINFVKSTYLLSPEMKENLAYLALAEKKEQSDVVREAISNHLVVKKLDPTQAPIFSFSN